MNKRFIRTIILTLALLTGATSETWATLTRDSIIINTPTGQGTVVKSVDDRTVTLTVTPASGYYIKRSDIKVQALIATESAPARRQAPSAGYWLTVTGPESSKEEASYTFYIPTDYAGAMVDVTFKELEEATVEITPNILTYTGTAQQLVTQGAITGGSNQNPVTYSLVENGTYTYDLSTITGTDAGEYTVYYKVAPDATHTEGSGSKSVTIAPATLTEAVLDATVKKQNQNIYDEVIFNVIKLKAGNVVENSPVENTHYTVSGNMRRDVGSQTMTVTGIGNFKGSVNISVSLVTNDATIQIVSSSNAATAATTGKIILSEDVSYSQLAALWSTTDAFTGELDGDFHTIDMTGCSHALFNSINTGKVKNVFLKNVSISQSGHSGGICNDALGATRIYNCGILDGSVKSTGTSLSEDAADCCGGIVGFLDGTARVINCYSYADITGGNRVGGIVGYNNVTTTSSNLKTMVMNCMFYGDITDGKNKAPIYNGKIITNVSTGTGASNKGVSNFNYFRAEASYVQNRDIQTYNCALLAETRYLQRFEFFRHLLNGHRELAAWWATGDRAKKNQMAKWVMEPSQIGGETPYPILKTPGYYPSVVNIDAEKAPLTAVRNKGGRLGTLNVRIQMGNGGTYTAPTGAQIITGDTVLVITDKDPDHFNFNYYKVQLPYYNNVGTKNYTGNRVVTGWKIVEINGGTTGTLTTTGSDVTFKEDGSIDKMPYNFADRNCTDKDLYSKSNRVFNQGAYWDVPEGVQSITIEPYWAKCVYLADPNADKVYNTNMTNGYDVPNVGGGQIYTNGNSYFIAGENQVVYTTMGNAISSTNSTGLFVGISEDDRNKQSVYDYAVVLVGNYHHYYTTNNAIEASKSKPYTVTSVDLDGDNEPDYSFMLRFDGREVFHPVRYDFLNLVGLGMAQKSDRGTGTYNFGIPQPRFWFEVTNTALFRVTQMEYDTNGRNASPYILHGGVIEQWVSGQSNNVTNKTTYILVGGNVWFKEFHLGCHIDATHKTKHPPVSVTGGDYGAFYLTGLYSNADNYDDNAECYVNGGRFGTVAGTGMEGVGNNSSHANGHITWQIDNADINTFYGGGINAAKPAEGNINTIISNSHVGVFCGGPQFGDMNSERTVKTTATGCTFGTFFGAGFGGNSYYTAAPGNFTNASTDQWNADDKGFNLDWDKWVNGEIKSASVNSGNYSNGTAYTGYNRDYIGAFGGVSSGITYEFLPVSGNTTNVARLFLKFVKFSLATTHSVTSTLTDCTITGNFYGGGSLGKVDGDVTSTLTNCKVHGNVFGAGFSAELPTVEMMETGGFKKQPYYDKNLGVYLPGEYKDSEIFRWEQATIVNSTETAINPTDKILYTTEILAKSNLGSVAGNVTLTIKGNSEIGTEGDTTKGNVFGGGEQSYVTKAKDNNDNPVANTGNTTVNLEGNTQVLGNVFGGGDEGVVEGSTTVNIKD